MQAMTQASRSNLAQGGSGAVEQGPRVNALSGRQLRFVARIKTLRPAAELRWRSGRGGWSLDVVERITGRPDKSLLKARLGSDGSIRTMRSWL
jgi:hypothetical protein